MYLYFTVTSRKRSFVVSSKKHCSLSFTKYIKTFALCGASLWFTKITLRSEQALRTFLKYA